MAELPDYVVEKVRHGESVPRDVILAMTIEQRLALQWEMTKYEYGVTDDTPMRRDIARVIRPGDPRD